MAASIGRLTCRRALRGEPLLGIIRSRFSTRTGSNENKEIVFSGIQPTGVPHLGNYLGAIEHWVALQNSGRFEQVFYCIVDLHSITAGQPDPQTLRRSLQQTLACLLAAGIDPDKSVLFQQSDVPEHAELAWILSCCTSMPRLSGMTHWKEKSAKHKGAATLGLFSYPVLQSADILLYKATHVPIGEDQQQHLRLTCDLARIFNNRYGPPPYFPMPLPIYSDCKRIKSLREPTSKMSKSDNNALGRIELTDTADQILNKIRKAVTDCTSAVTYDPQGRPGVANLIDIHSAVTGLTPDQICQQARGQETAQYKVVVGEAVVARLSPIRQRVGQLSSQPDYLQAVLAQGAHRARQLAATVYGQVRRLVGFK